MFLQERVDKLPHQITIVEETKEQAGNPAQGSKKFLKYARDTFVKSSPNFQCRKIPQWIRIRLEHRFSLT